MKWVLAAALVSSLTLAEEPGTPTAPPSVPAAIAQPKAAPVAAPRIVSRAALMKQPPFRNFPAVMRSWIVDPDLKALVRLHQIVGTVPMHLHHDSEERVWVIEGKIRMTIGDQLVDLGPGDYVAIPAGMKHKVELAKGTKRAIVEGINLPAPDPKQTDWLEPAPVPAK